MNPMNLTMSDFFQFNLPNLRVLYLFAFLINHKAMLMLLVCELYWFKLAQDKR